jgi:diguanylate cyclase (GGDEF)-like protein
MARPTPADRTRLVLRQAARALADPGTRAVVLGSGLVGNLALHLLLRDTNLAWASAPLVLLAGLAGGVRTAMWIAAAVGIGHTVIDVAVLDQPIGPVGLLVRLAVLVGVALIGSVGALIEAQRDRAMHRAVSEDPVTGLLSVRAFYDALAELRREGTGFTIVLADIRGMRALNERYGHPTGTEAMRALAHVLRRATGPEALVSRLGSDEVAVALVGDDRERCRRIVDEVISRLHDEQVSLPDGDRFEVHATYGIARYPEDGHDEVSVLRAADHAKQQAKTAAGADQVGTAAELPS